MLELTDAQIGTWVATFILPLFRVTAVLMTMPILGTRMLPARVRLYVAVAITVVIVPALPPLPEFDPLSLRGLLLCAEQIIVGALFGLALQLLFQAFVIAALLVVNIAFGVMTRAAPQLNIFSIGFPLTLVMGMFIFWVGLADVLSHYQALASEALQWLRELARAR